MFNFEETVEILARSNGAVQVGSAEELTASIAALAADDGERARLGDAAREAIQSRQGAAARTAELIRNVLAASGAASQNGVSHL
jgi:3-deoxy-D-manno-octulosonic-acid transferase